MKVMNKKGQALVEYVLIIALISVVAITAVTLLGGALKDKITEASCGLVGEKYVAGEKSGQGYCASANE